MSDEMTPFDRLAKGQSFGKSSILIYDPRVDIVQQAPVDVIVVEGQDLDAQQLVLTLHLPRVTPLCFEDDVQGIDQQSVAGEQADSGSGVQWPPLMALIEFGTGGVSTKVIVDYLDGATLSVVASYLRVSALVTQGKCSDDISGTRVTYYLAATVSPGCGETRVQRTIFVDDGDKGDEGAMFDVPKFAKVAVLVGAIGWIRFWQDCKGEHCVGNFFVTDSQRRVEIPEAAHYFSVLNESGHKTKLSVIFELAL